MYLIIYDEHKYLRQHVDEMMKGSGQVIIKRSMIYKDSAQLLTKINPL